MEGLGRLYDISPCIIPVDLTTAGNTGLRVCLRDCDAVDFVIMTAVGTAAQDIVVDIQQANAATAGTAKDLDVIAKMYYKTSAAVTGAEKWVKQTQTKASEIAITALYPIAEEEDIAVFHVEAADLDFAGGYYWAFLIIDDVGANSQVGVAFAIRTGLNVQRDPANLRNPQA